MPDANWWKERLRHNREQKRPTGLVCHRCQYALVQRDTPRVYQVEGENVTVCEPCWTDLSKGAVKRRLTKRVEQRLTLFDAVVMDELIDRTPKAKQLGTPTKGKGA